MIKSFICNEVLILDCGNGNKAGIKIHRRFQGACLELILDTRIQTRVPFVNEHYCDFVVIKSLYLMILIMKLSDRSVACNFP
jgi:hypothetical protein